MANNNVNGNINLELGKAGFDESEWQKIIWEDIEIEINYVENYSAVHEKTYGDIMSHITIKAGEELPISETGFKSIFILKSNVERWGGVEKYIIDELNEAAKSKAWKFKQASKNQLCLF